MERGAGKAAPTRCNGHARRWIQAQSASSRFSIRKPGTCSKRQTLPVTRVGGVGEVNCSDSAVDIDESLSSTFEVVSETSVDDLSHEDRGSALVDGRETGEAV